MVGTVGCTFPKSVLNRKTRAEIKIRYGNKIGFSKIDKNTIGIYAKSNCTDAAFVSLVKQLRSI